MMAQVQELTASPLARSEIGLRHWLFSWPLLTGLAGYLYAFSRGQKLLADGDTYWHIAAGDWIFRHASVPSRDPFSHSMPGASWTAHEWLSEVVLALAHQLGGWTLVVGVTALAFAATISLLTRALLRWLEPVYVLLFAGFAIAMTSPHLFARPHILSMPLMMLWTIELVRASEAGRSPSLWVLPLLTLWANLHGGFTLGIALAFAFAAEGLINASKEHRLAGAAREWVLFLVLMLVAALITPSGTEGILFTWQVLFESSYSLQRIGEWQSPNFHELQPFEIWLLAGLAMVVHQGLRLPPIRLALLIGLLHLALKHIRYIELLGLLVPLFVATPFANQWRQTQRRKQQLESVDRMFLKLAQPAGRRALVAAGALFVAVPAWISVAHPISPPMSIAPNGALEAVRKAAVSGPVLNHYSWGGYLIHAGIPPFIDGRADMYGDQFLKEYLEALHLVGSDRLEKLLDKHRITWTLLEPQTAAVAMLDHLPQWRRVYADKTAVVHARTLP